MTWYGEKAPCTSDRYSNFDRIKVDPGQTSFFEGREFRTYKELNVPVSPAVYVVRAVVPGDIILTGLRVDLDGGFLRLGTYVGGTPGGTWSETLPVFARNNMSVGPNKRYSPTPGVVITAGGTHTGGTELDVVRVRTVNQNNQVTTVGSVPGDDRGVAANTYYFRFQNLSATDVLTGTFHVSWEERLTPPASPYAHT